MSVRKFGARWGVDVEVNGVRQRLRSPENSRQAALAYEAQVRKKLLWAHGQGIEPAKPPTFAEFSKEWFETYVKTNNKPSEIAAKESRLRIHLVPFFGHLRLDALTGLSVERYKSTKIQSGQHPKSVNNQLAILSKLLRTAEEWGFLAQVPRIRFIRQVPKPQMRFLSDADCRRVLAAAAGTPLRSMILVGLHAGLRRGEILALRREDVDLERRQLLVRRSFSRGVLTTTKNSRWRFVPLDRVLYDEFSRLRGGTGFVFTDPSGRPWRANVASESLVRVGRRAGVPEHGRLGWHVLRHTFASHLAMAGVPIAAIKELLGHATLEMTMRYAHLSPQSLAAAVVPLETLGNESAADHGTPAALTTHVRSSTDGRPNNFLR